jgi:hypothetical protein
MSDSEEEDGSGCEKASEVQNKVVCFIFFTKFCLCVSYIDIDFFNVYFNLLNAKLNIFVNQILC